MIVGNSDGSNVSFLSLLIYFIYLASFLVTAGVSVLPSSQHSTHNGLFIIKMTTIKLCQALLQNLVFMLLLASFFIFIFLYFFLSLTRLIAGVVVTLDVVVVGESLMVMIAYFNNNKV